MYFVDDGAESTKNSYWIVSGCKRGLPAICGVTLNFSDNNDI